MFCNLIKTLAPKKCDRRLIKVANLLFLNGSNGTYQNSCAILLPPLQKFHTINQLNTKKVDVAKQKILSDDANNVPTADSIKQIKSLARINRLDDAIELYEKCKAVDGFQLTDSAALTLIKGLITANRVDQAKKFAENASGIDGHKSTSTESNELLCKIFANLASQSNFDEFNWFLDKLIFTRKYISINVLQIIVQSSLTKYQNENVTLWLIERIADQFRVTPKLHMVACELINREDVEGLQKILEISSKIHGKTNSFLNMAFAFVACNRVDQAKKIFDSLKITNDTERLQQLIENFRLRRHEKYLYNLLAATKENVSKHCREQMFVALLSLLLEENMTAEISAICSDMDQETIIPSDKDRKKLIHQFKQRQLKVPESWLKSTLDAYEVQLKQYLDENCLEKANELLLECLESKRPIERQWLRYCLMKNAKNGSIDIFVHLRTKFDIETKLQLNFFKYECRAYNCANKDLEYIKMIESAIEGTDGKIADLKSIAVSISGDIIDMIGKSTTVYDTFYNMAIQFADKGIIKPICIVWTYNWINNKNEQDNDIIWDKYLQSHPTIICKNVTKVFVHRKDVDKFRMFLNFDKLNKSIIATSELGASYSFLFDYLYFSEQYDVIIDELKKVAHLLPVKCIKPNTLQRIKFGPNKLGEQFWAVVNSVK